ncbi:MAG: ATP-binding protein [Bacteroidota bacterium]
MHFFPNDTIAVIILSSSIIILFAVAYIFILIFSNKRIINEQQTKIDEINKSEERYKALFENSLAGMMKLDNRAMKVYDANSSMLAIFHADSIPALETRLKEIPEQYVNEIRTLLSTYDRVTERELRMTGPDGKEQWLLFSARNSHADQLTHVVILDISEKKQLERAYVRAQKMETISLLTNSVAHDLQNIFAPIQMSVQSLHKHVTSKKGRTILTTAQKSADDGMILVKTILSVGGKVPIVRQKVELGRIIKQSVERFNRKAKKNVKARVPPKIPHFTILGDQQRLNQVFLNLMENARDAMPNGGTVTVSLKRIAPDDVARFIGKNDFTDHLVMISIADTGTGIPEQDHDRVFEPFYSTKRDRGGTGLGLSIVQSIVKEHGGSIALQSTIDHGTIINVVFPLYRNGRK